MNISQALPAPDTTHFDTYAERLYDWKPFFVTNLLKVSIGRGLGGSREIKGEKYVSVGKKKR